MWNFQLEGGSFYDNGLIGYSVQIFILVFIQIWVYIDCKFYVIFFVDIFRVIKYFCEYVFGFIFQLFGEILVFLVSFYGFKFDVEIYICFVIFFVMYINMK